MPAAMVGHPGHALYLHDDEEALLDVVLRFVAEGQYHGQRTVVISSDERLDRLQERLVQHGLEGSAVGHSAEAVLEQVLVGGSPDRERFRATMRDLLAAHEPGTVRVHGDTAALLAARGSADGALQLELLCDELVAELAVQHLCAHPRAQVSPDDAVCRAHGDFRQ